MKTGRPGASAPSQLLVAGAAPVVSGPPENGPTIERPDAIQNGRPDGPDIVDTVRKEMVDAQSSERGITAANVGFGFPVSPVEGSAARVEDTGEGSLNRFPNGSDTDDASIDWLFALPVSPGAFNTD